MQRAGEVKQRYIPDQCLYDQKIGNIWYSVEIGIKMATIKNSINLKI